MSNFREEKILALASAFFITTLLSTAMSGEGLQKYGEELRAIAREVNPSVVTIHIGGRDNDPPEQRRDRDDPPEVRKFFREWRWPGDNPLELLEKNEELQRLFMLRRSGREASRSDTGTGIIMDPDIKGRIPFSVYIGIAISIIIIFPAGIKGSAINLSSQSTV